MRDLNKKTHYFIKPLNKIVKEVSESDCVGILYGELHNLLANSSIINPLCTDKYCVWVSDRPLTDFEKEYPFMDVAYTCSCGKYVHPSNINRSIHFKDCYFGTDEYNEKVLLHRKQYREIEEKIYGKENVKEFYG